jgi:hypothetical protein
MSNNDLSRLPLLLRLAIRLRLLQPAPVSVRRDPPRTRRTRRR